MLPEDNSFNWGAVLLRLLPWEQTQRKDLVMSVLRALAYNPSLAVDAPKWQPKARFRLALPCFVWVLSSTIRACGVRAEQQFVESVLDVGGYSDSTSYK